MDYSEIATIEVDGRCVLDVATDPLDNSLALVTVEPDSMSSSVRVYHVGRRRSQVPPPPRAFQSHLLAPSGGS